GTSFNRRTSSVPPLRSPRPIAAKLNVRDLQCGASAPQPRLVMLARGLPMVRQQRGVLPEPVGIYALESVRHRLVPAQARLLELRPVRDLLRQRVLEGVLAGVRFGVNQIGALQGAQRVGELGFGDRGGGRRRGLIGQRRWRLEAEPQYRLGEAFAD